MKINGEKLDEAALFALFEQHAPQMNIADGNFDEASPLFPAFKAIYEEVNKVLARAYAECSMSPDPTRAILEGKERYGELIAAAVRDAIDAFIEAYPNKPEKP